KRLGHEGDGVAVGDGGVLDDVLVLLQVVGGRQERVELHVDFGLARGPDFVVLHLDVDSGIDQVERQFGADVVQAVWRGVGAVSAMPVDCRYFSAVLATWRGSRLYFSRVMGSSMSQTMLRVACSVKASM